MNVGGLIGLVFGALSGLAGVYFGHKQGKKERANDEVHDYIWQKARSYSWFATLGVIYLLLLLTLLGFSISTISVLSILLVVQLGGWGMAGAILAMKIYSESKADRQIYLFLLIFFIIFISVMIFFSFYLT